MTPDEAAIRALIQRWHDATAVGDVDTVLALMAEDVVFLVPGHAPMTGRATFEAGLGAIVRTDRIRSTGDVEEVQVSGDLAFAVTKLTVRIEPLDGGAPDIRTGHAMSVFRRDASGGWRLIRDANLLAAGGG